MQKHKILCYVFTFVNRNFRKAEAFLAWRLGFGFMEVDSHLCGD